MVKYKVHIREFFINIEIRSHLGRVLIGKKQKQYVNVKRDLQCHVNYEN